MVFHVGRYFPERFMMTGERAALETVRTAIGSAGHYGIVMKRDVCLYLNCMLVLGSGFDRDPKFGWAAAILAGSGSEDPTRRMTRVNGKMLELAKAWRPSMLGGLSGCLADVESNCLRAVDGRIHMSTRMIVEYLSDSHTDVSRCFTLNELNELTALGQAKSDELGLNSPIDRVLCTTLMFLLGAGFDNDPQFPWVKAAIGQLIGTGGDERMLEILRGTILHVERAIACHNIQYT